MFISSLKTHKDIVLQYSLKVILDKLRQILCVIMIDLDLTILPENYRLYHIYNKPQLGK